MRPPAVSTSLCVFVTFRQEKKEQAGYTAKHTGTVLAAITHIIYRVSEESQIVLSVTSGTTCSPVKLGLNVT